MTWFFSELWVDIFWWTAVTWYLFKNIHLQDEHLVDILGGQRVKIYRCTVQLSFVESIQTSNISIIPIWNVLIMKTDDRYVVTWATFKKIVKILKGFKRFQCNPEFDGDGRSKLFSISISRSFRLLNAKTFKKSFMLLFSLLLQPCP